MNPWVIIPVKSLHHGKSRLSAILTLEKRYELNKELLLKTLAIALEYSSNIVVVSPCPAALQIAQKAGVFTLNEHAPHNLNSGLKQASTWIRNRNVSSFLILSCDLPYATVDDLKMINNHALNDESMVVATDSQKQGTNALYLRTQKEINYRFGSKSLELHLHEAKSCELSTFVIHDSRLSLDLDTPHDYEKWISSQQSV